MIKTIIKIYIMSLIIFGFTGCGTVVVSNISVFHKLPVEKKNAKTTYVFEKFKWQNNNLEYDHYQEKIKNYLLKNNFIENKKSNIIIKFNYGIDNGTEKIGSLPIIGQTGVSSSYTSGTVTSYGGGYGSYSGNTTYTPSYGVVGSSSYSYSSYKRFLTLLMFDKSTKKLIYEAKVLSNGSSSQINMVIDEMIEAINIGSRVANITGIGWEIGLFKKLSFIQVVKNDRTDLYSSSLPIKLNDGEDAKWLVSLDKKNNWIELFSKNLGSFPRWNLYWLRLIVVTANGKTFKCKIGKSLKDELLKEYNKQSKNNKKS